METYMEEIRAKFARFRAKLLGTLKSCTIWFNGIMAVMPTFLDYAQTQLPMLMPFIPNQLYAYAFGITVVGNMMLRFKTNKPLDAK